MGDIFDDVEKMLEEENGEVIEAKTSENIEEGSFNESELEDIMAEIESLESDFHDTAETQVVAAKDYVAEELAEETEADSVEMAVISPEESVVEVENATAEFTDDDFIQLDSQNSELVTDSSVAPKTDLQNQIEQEMELARAIIEKEKLIVEPVENVLPLESKKVTVVEKVYNEEAPVSLTAPAVSSPITSKNATTFQASGSMNLSLSFKLGDKVASLKIDDTEGLVVTLEGVELVLNETSGCSLKMENGVNINIPLTDKVSSSKKIAA